MPCSMSSRAALVVTMLPTSTGTPMSATRAEKRRPVKLLEMWRAVVTVDCTTMMSAPASTATGASFLVLAGVTDTAQTAPVALISRTRWATRWSWNGAE